MRTDVAILALEGRVLLSTVPAGFAESLVAGGLQGLTAMEVAPDGRIFLAQQDGTIRILHDDQLDAEPFAKLTVDSYGERGLLGITLDPQFEQNQYVYVYYCSPTPTSHNRISRLTANGDEVVPGSEVVLMDLPPVPNAVWHMGGGMHFGLDGKLYVGVGMHEQVPAGQDLNTVFGKMLRINRDGSIPADNPFYNTLSGQNRAIWAYGLRNPYTSAIDPVTGRMYINDVGQSAFEEVNLGAAGANYGWAITEGYTTAPGITSPVYAYPHTAFGGAVTGGTFYRSAVPQFPASYVGKYFFEEFVGGWIRVLDPATNQVSDFASGLVFPCDMRVGADGSLYYLSRGSGSGEGGGPGTGTPGVYKIQFVAPTAPKITAQPAAQTVALGEPATFAVSAIGATPLTYQWQRNGSDIQGATEATYSIPAAGLTDGGAAFRCVVTNALGSVTSSPATLTVINGARPTPSITVPAIGSTYAAGDTIAFAGDASDAEDGASLPANAFTWTVDFHHHTHTHPFLAPVTGVKSGSFVIPLRGEADPDVFYRITLTVTDSSGLSRTTFRDVSPRLANLTVATNVPGLTVNLDSKAITGSATVTSTVNLTRTLSAPRYQYESGIAYEFDSWSDGGAITHDIPFPASDATYTARYRLASTVYLGDLVPLSSTSGWGPVEVDQSNGERTIGDGRPIRLEGVTYARGLGAHAPSEIVYDLGGAFARFKASVGVDDEVGQSAGSVVFQVWADGVKLFDSGVMRGNTATKSVDVPVTGRQQLRLVITDAGDGNSDDHADWADAKLIASAGDGLSATYFNNADLTGAMVSRVDPTVDFNWQQGAPVSGISAGTFSVRWTGLVQPLYSETYSFFIKADDGVRLWIDDQLLIDRWTDTPPLPGDVNLDHVVDRADLRILLAHFARTTGMTWADGDTNGDGRVDFKDYQRLERNFGRTWPAEDAGTITLQAGQQYDVRLEYYQNAADASVRLMWASPSQAKQVIPQALLFSVPAVPPAAPGGLTATPSGSAIGLNWTNVKQELGYRIERSTDGVHFLQIGSTAAGVTNFTDAGLPPAARFYYRVRAFNAAGNSGDSNGADATTAGSGVVYLSDLTPASSSNGWGVVERDTSNGENSQFDGGLMSINGAKYAKGLGAHAVSQITYTLPANTYGLFQADVGVDDEVTGGSVVFEVWSGNTRLYQSPRMLHGTPPLPVSVNIAGRTSLTLKVLDGGDGVTQDHADWANARLVAATGATAAATSSFVTERPFSVTRVSPRRPPRRQEGLW